MKRKYYLLIFTAMVLYSFYANLQFRLHLSKGFTKRFIPLSENKCMESEKIYFKPDMEQVSLQFGDSPLGPATTTSSRHRSQQSQSHFKQPCGKLHLRPELVIIVAFVSWTLWSELENCCNATGRLIVTQENTQIGHVFNYESKEKKTITVNEDIFQMLPKKSPFPKKPIKQCAVVGNGGILYKSSCGSEIDQADFVFRLNLPPLIPEEDTGRKTDVVSANPSILEHKFQSLTEKRKPFIDKINTYGAALILMSAFSYTGNTAIAFRVLHSLEDVGLNEKVIFFHPEYIKNLHLYWTKRGIQVKRLSSGFILANAALELCEKVKLYGFWPFSKDLNGNEITHHYYDNVLPNTRLHSMPDEFFYFVQMNTHRSVYLKVGNC
ncbi:alpha-2,8-sialyltransferase 8F-like [Bombina bombina]|uniref:alpha-2,8-sialyltransferase 8F-like n=1 Tax=Bombina bombina TaxID=8345 RepID=UPI00235A7314|nr:alpha-2,8-sialyltransferase 8F-like [Bombina bombina]